MKFFSFFVLFFLFSLPAKAEKLSVAERQAAVLEKAQALGHDPQWLRLLHFHGLESTIDSRGFFLSPAGKKDPQAELNATLVSFFNGESLCLFPARRQWLAERLEIGDDLIKQASCPAYEKFKTTLDADKVSLIYTTAFLGNPASYFGHTLLRLDSRKNLPLLAHAVNYGAMTGSDDGLFYAVKGVFGVYPGVFSVYPYYDTVNLYNNMENRDLWEYRLNLTEKQADFLTAHIWELGHQTADYYFFSENCSYMILETLNVVFPQTDWSEGLRPFTIPVDTVRLILARNDLLKEAVYRPSRQTKIKTAYAVLSAAERKELAELVNDPANKAAALSFATDRNALLLETAYEYLQYRYITEKISMTQLREGSIALLKARNALDVPQTLPVPKAPGVRPDQAHLSSAVTVTGGRSNRRNFTEITLKPALHTVLDKADGYLPFSGIDYLKTTVRYDNEHALSVRRFDLVDIVSYAPQDALFRPFSFHVTVGQNRFFYSPTGKDISVFDAQSAIGFSTLLHPSLNVFALLSGTFKAGGQTVAGAGMTVGFLADFGQVRLKGTVQPTAFTKSEANMTSFQAALSVSLTTNLDWVTEFSFDDGRRHDRHEIKTGLQKHF